MPLKSFDGGATPPPTARRLGKPRRLWHISAIFRVLLKPSHERWPCSRIAVAKNQHGATLFANWAGPNKAAELYRRAADLRPEHPETWHGLGVSLGDLGAEFGIAAAFQRAANLVPVSASFSSDHLHLLQYDPVAIQRCYRAGHTVGGEACRAIDPARGVAR